MISGYVCHFVFGFKRWEPLRTICWLYLSSSYSLVLVLMPLNSFLAKTVKTWRSPENFWRRRLTLTPRSLPVKAVVMHLQATAAVSPAAPASPRLLAVVVLNTKEDRRLHHKVYRPLDRASRTMKTRMTKRRMPQSEWITTFLEQSNRILLN